MNPKLRRTLAEAHIPVIAIAFLYFWSIKSLTIFLVDVLAFTFHPPAMDYLDPFLNAKLAAADVARAHDLVIAIAGVTGAWVFSLWVHGIGPIELLRDYGRHLSGRTNA